MNIVTSLLQAWFGVEEYQEVWYQYSRNWSLLFRFWGRLILAAVGLCFFLWQQIVEPSQWWGSDNFAMFVLAFTASQATGPFFYLLIKITKRIFLTKHYLETLKEGRFYVTRKSALCIVLMTLLSLGAIFGLLDFRWYLKPLVFLLSVPVAYFWIFFPTLNWVAGKVRELPTVV